MTKLLVINSSPMGENSVSRKLTAAFVEKYTARNSDAVVTDLDVSVLELPHLQGDVLAGFFAPAETHSPEQAAHAKRSEKLIAQFKEADAIVIGVPMHNFGIPSTLKAYIDHISRAGHTFKYTEKGPVGLVEDKPIYILGTRGGDYSASGYPQLDFVLPYLKSVLGLLGVHNVTLIQANSLARGEEAVATAVNTALNEIEAALAA